MVASLRLLQNCWQTGDPDAMMSPTSMNRMLSRRTRDTGRSVPSVEEITRERQQAFEDALMKERLANEDTLRRTTGQVRSLLGWTVGAPAVLKQSSPPLFASSFVCVRGGQPVMYGQVIQLLHVKSRNFLHILPNVLSFSERSASAVEVRDKQRHE